MVSEEDRMGLILQEYGKVNKRISSSNKCYYHLKWKHQAMWPPTLQAQLSVTFKSNKLLQLSYMEARFKSYKAVTENKASLA